MTILVAVFKDILVPTLTYKWWFWFGSDKIAVHHYFPESPFNIVLSLNFVNVLLSISYTYCWCNPSMSKNVFAHPIVGTSKTTPKWQAYPQLNLCTIPFPSTIINWGQYYGCDFLRSSNNFKVGGSYLKAKKPGIYGSNNLTY